MTIMIHIVCPHCDTVLEAQPEAAGISYNEVKDHYSQTHKWRYRFRFFRGGLRVKSFETKMI
jgi:hypothetical protein